VKSLGLFLLFPCIAFAQVVHEREIQRAIIELDRRGADFARGTVSPPLAPDVGQPLSADPVIARELRPYERMRAAQGSDHVLQLPPPVVQKPIEKPLPLPGGPRPGVDPVTLPGGPG
jgi:hypothetical protein